MSEFAHLIYVVDDDERVRESMLELLSSFAFHAVAFPGDVAHSYANPRTQPARFSLVVFEPGVGAGPRTDVADD